MDWRRPHERAKSAYYIHGHNNHIDDAERFWRLVEKTETCWLWTGAKSPKGYGRFHVGGHAANSVLAHRWAWAKAYGEPLEPGQPLLHSCDTPACVKREHLRIGTIHENNAEMAAKGRSNHGERHMWSKLTEDQVRTIRRLYRDGVMNQGQLGRAFNISESNISRIISGHNWPHTQ